MSDLAKPPMYLVPLDAIAEIARVMDAGNKTHPERVPDDWKQMPNAMSRLLSAALRHIGEHQYGNETDDETKCPHLAHAATNLVMALWHLKHGEKRGQPCQDA